MYKVVAKRSLYFRKRNWTLNSFYLKSRTERTFNEIQCKVAALRLSDSYSPVIGGDVTKDHNRENSRNADARVSISIANVALIYVSRALQKKMSFHSMKRSLRDIYKM